MWHLKGAQPDSEESDDDKKRETPKYRKVTPPHGLHGERKSDFKRPTPERQTKKESEQPKSKLTPRQPEKARFSERKPAPMHPEGRFQEPSKPAPTHPKGMFQEPLKSE